ncbi:MAG: hypothetical protein AVDCRST_MAG12-942 [uncultured Rubrobacteraceae bacterium]|uniref:N-acetyltransferase domain-containing protein n=1 Tax=uncultured Rubrobacteraceae bacterium TaxID=349277 RepID=A0A6J4RRF7_9ACTN|nr:MAG: hypothetical protein AVDCRST_MAG12-942 [uncultured Rubrobacteraceae bacterium]
MDYEVVTAGSGEVGALVRLCSALFREDAGTRDPCTEVGWPEAHGREHFSAMISSDDALCLIAACGGTSVGYLAGLIQRPTTVRPVRIAEVQSMYVETSSRGRGVGSALVSEFLSWAGNRRADRVSVTAYAANEEAMGFYSRLGFRPRSTTLEKPL